ncbi:ATP-binding protein, partial [Mesorhizobium sp. M8A.F.Ca.ET.059.01.1.1]
MDYGILAVGPDSSESVRQDLAKDLDRLAQGRSDNLTDIGEELYRRLQAIGGAWQTACTRVVVRVVHALETDGADIRTAKEVLRSVCANDDDADSAWNALYQDAVLRIERRGRWSIPYLLDVLRAANIEIRDSEFPAAIARKLADWVQQTNDSFMLPAVRKSLPLDALVEMRTVSTAIDQPSPGDAAAALARYHSSGGSLDRNERIFDAEWTGQFKLNSVVVAGPGLGKSTLMTLLAKRYASGGLPVLTVNLKQIAAAITSGLSFDEALLRHGLDGSGISPQQFERSSLKGLVVLADGLDDCGIAHDAVGRALRVFAIGHPSARVIVTTRPIGYTTASLADWQHYRLLAPDKNNGAGNLAKLLNALSAGDDANETAARAKRELNRSRAADAISSSPLLLGMAVAVIDA